MVATSSATMIGGTGAAAGEIVLNSTGIQLNVQSTTPNLNAPLFSSSVVE